MNFLSVSKKHSKGTEKLLRVGCFWRLCFDLCESQTRTAIGKLIVVNFGVVGQAADRPSSCGYLVRKALQSGFGIQYRMTGTI